MRRWFSLLCFSVGVARAACPGSLPTEFEQSFGPAFAQSFEVTFYQSFVSGFVGVAGIPEGWDAEDFGQYATHWWMEKLGPEMPAFVAAQQRDVLQTLANGPLCTEIEGLMADPDQALLAADPAALTDDEKAKRDAAMARLTGFQTKLQEELAPFQIRSSEAFVAHVGQERLHAMGVAFATDVEANSP